MFTAMMSPVCGIYMVSPLRRGAVWRGLWPGRRLVRRLGMAVRRRRGGVGKQQDDGDRARGRAHPRCRQAACGCGGAADTTVAVRPRCVRGCVASSCGGIAWRALRACCVMMWRRVCARADMRACAVQQMEKDNANTLKTLDKIPGQNSLKATYSQMLNQSKRKLRMAGCAE